MGLKQEAALIETMAVSAGTFAANMGQAAANAERIIQVVAAASGLSFRPTDPGLSFRPNEPGLDFTPALTSGGNYSGKTRGHGGGGSGGRAGGYSGSSRSGGSVGDGGMVPDNSQQGPSYAYTFATAGGGSSGVG